VRKRASSPTASHQADHDITPKEIRRLLDAGNVVIVAGFQGQTSSGHITTLGRGGSDLTAIALAAALKADLCQIYTDVEGVFTADPHVVPNVHKLDEISYDEMLELAGSGAKVMQLRSVEIAKKFGVVFEVRSSLTSQPGTIVKEETRSMEDIVVRGVAVDRNQAKLTIIGVPDQPGVAARVFRALADGSQRGRDRAERQPCGSHAMTACRSPWTSRTSREARAVIGGTQDLRRVPGSRDDQIAKLSIVGVGMRSHARCGREDVRDAGARKHQHRHDPTSEIRVSVVIGLGQATAALRAVHRAFVG
jgi:aspartate kinase